MKETKKISVHSHDEGDLCNEQCKTRSEWRAYMKEQKAFFRIVEHLRKGH